MQLCYDLHDGMYECDCRPGYTLHADGYSCYGKLFFRLVFVFLPHSIFKLRSEIIFFIADYFFTIKTTFLNFLIFLVKKKNKITNQKWKTLNFILVHMKIYIFYF